MTTGQYPKRRETDEQAEKRVANLEARRAEHMAKPIVIRDFSLFGRRRISSSGRLL